MVILEIYQKLFYVKKILKFQNQRRINQKRKKKNSEYVCITSENILIMKTLEKNPELYIMYNSS